MRRAPSIQHSRLRGKDQAKTTDAKYRPSAHRKVRRAGIADGRPCPLLGVPGPQHELMQRAVRRAQEGEATVAPAREKPRDRVRRDLGPGRPDAGEEAARWRKS